MGLLQNKDRKESTIYIALALFIIAVYISGLFPEITIDSAKFAAISRNIFESHDLTHLKVAGSAYMHKPPLLFWLGALSFKILGVSVFSFKIPNLIYSFLGCYSLYRLGALLYDRSTGLTAALLFSTCEAFFLFNMDVHTDLLLTSNLIFGIWQFTEYINKKRILNMVLGFVGTGLAMISKGMPGLAIAVFTIVGYLVVRRDWNTLFSFKWLIGIPIILIILYPGLKGVYDHFGNEGLKFYFWSNNIDRMAGAFTTSKPDYLFCIHTVAFIFIPWSVYAFPKFVVDFMDWKKGGFSLKNQINSLCYSGILIYSAVVSISSQQAPHYLLPIIPFVALLTARFIIDISKEGTLPKRYRLVIILRNLMASLLWVFAIITAVYFFPTTNLLVWIPVIIMFFISILSVAWLRDRFNKLILIPLISIGIFNFISNTVYMPSAVKYHGPIQASYTYNADASDTDTLYTYDYQSFETYFYPKKISGYIYSEDLKEIVAKGNCWIITTQKGLDEIEALNSMSIAKKFVFPYKKLANISIMFLNPKTRNNTLSKVYLIKLT
jgi:4-amino-4-deoxy-L-arabinose transferase-like glycosyltransferase